MKRVPTLFLALTAPLFLVADNGPASVEEIVERDSGGYFLTTHRKTKKVFFINAQNRANEALVNDAKGNVSELLRTPIDLAKGEFSFPYPKIEGELSLYIIDDEKMPMSLVSPEGRWAFVNVAKLVEGRGAQPQFFAARFRKEVMRLSGILFGGIGSGYPNNLFSLISSAEELDRYDNESFPADRLIGTSGFLKGVGVRPFRKVSYRRACQEGWAPAPTNDIQKAIWDKVHALPTTPLKIKPETKKVAE